MLLITSVVAPVAAVGSSDVTAVDSTTDAELALASSDSTQQASTTDDGLRSLDGNDEPVGGLTAPEQGSTISATDASCDLIVESGGSIQSAIATADWNETVCVESGTYEEDLWIDTGSLTLVATGDVTLVPDDETSTGVYVNASAVTVEGFEVREFSRGIHVASDANNVEVRNNLLTANDVGVHLAEVTGTVIDGNTITSNVGNGIVFSGSSPQENVEITDNTITHNEYHAINAIASTGANGASGTFVSDNTVRDNTGTSSSPAITFRRSSDTTIVDNDVQHDGQIAIDFREYSSDALIERNTITNTSRGIHLSEVSLIEIRDNDIEELSASAIWMRDSSSVDIVDNRLDENGQGIYSRGLDSLFVEHNTISSEGSDLSLSSTTDATVRDNAFAHGVAMSSGQNEQEAAHFLHEFEDNTVGGDELVYVRDVDGETITPSSYPDAAQLIVVNSMDVEISNFDLDGTVAAIQLGVTEGTTVAHNTISDGVDGEKGGIVDMGSTGSVIEHNDVSSVQYGIQLVGGSENVVRDNTVSDTTGSSQAYTFGIHLERYGENHVVRDNTVTGSYSDGIHVAQYTDGTLVEGNTLEDNDRHGLQIRWNAADSVVRNNELSGNSDDGIHLERADRTVLENNDISENTRGIVAGRNTEDLWIEGNTVTDNSHQGIQLEPPGGFTSGDAPYNATIRENEISDNGREGILLEEAAAATIEGNTITDNGHVDPTWGWAYGSGIELSEAIDATVEDNTIEGSVVDGVVVGSGSANAVLSDNTVTDSGERGFYVDATNATLRDNVITGNPEGLVSGGDEVDARWNWWGAESGPSGGVSDPETGTTASGSGDSVSSDVRFDPWTGTEPVDDAPQFAVSITETNSPITFGETLTVDVTVENTGTEAGTQIINLEAFDGSVVDSLEELSLDPDENHAATLTWETVMSDAGSGEVTVRSDDDDATASVSVIHDDPVPDSGTLSGTVTDAETGNGIQGATVTATDLSTGETYAVMTSAGGHYDLENPDGTYDVLFEVEFSEQGEFIPEVVEDVEISEDETTLLDVELDPFEPVTFEPAEPVVDETVTFDASELSPPDAEAEGYLWVFEIVEGEYDLFPDRFTTDPITEHSFATAGDHDVVVLALSGDGIDQLATELPEEVCDISNADECTFEESDFDVGDEPREGDPVVGEIDFGEVAYAHQTVTVVEADDPDPEPEPAPEPEPEPSGEVVVYGASADQDELLVDEPFTVSVDLFNSGENTVDEPLVLEVDGETVDAQLVSVDPGATSRAATLLWTPSIDDLPANDDSTTVSITVNGFFVGEFSVDNQYTDVQVIAAAASETEVIEGEELHVIGSVYQAGTIAEEEEIELTATRLESNETTTVGTQTVTVAPNVYHLGALNISFAPEQAGTYELELGDRSAGTVEVDAAESDIQVIAASTSEVELIEGEETHVVGSIYQAGNVESTEEIELTATNRETGETDVIGSQEATLSPGFYHLGAINISYVPDEAGTYDLELGDRNAGSVEVDAAESDIQVIAASTSEVELIEGEETHVVGSIYQAGNVEGTEEIELTATHNETGETTVVGSQEVSLSPGFYHLGAINISYVPDEAGTYDLELGDRNAGWVEVEEAVSDIQVIAASTSEVELIEGEETHVVGSIYQAGNVEGTEEIELTATHNETGETTVVGSQEVSLSPGFYHLGGINISYVPDEAGTYDLELGDRSAGWVEVEEAVSDIQVIAASPSDVELVEGEEFHVIGSIYQAGNVEGTEAIELTATHNETDETTVLGSQEVSLAPGFYHLGALNVSAELEDAGDYDLELGDRDVGTVTVDELVTDIRVVGASLSDVELIEGEELSVVGSVYQNGSDTATESIELTASHQETGDTELVGSQDVTLSPGYYHLGAINISYVPDEPGTYDLELGDQNAGTVEVDAAESDIQVIAASTSEVDLIEGEETHIVGSIYQAGNVEGTEEIELTATHNETDETTVVGSQEVTLSPGYYHLGAINISYVPDEPGTYDLELGGTNAGWVEVDAAESDIQVIAASTSEVELIEGEETHVVGSIYQAGNVESTEEIELTATHNETGETDVIGSQEATLSPGFYHLGAINISYVPDEPGTYNLELGDQNAGTVEVAAAESDIQVIAASTSDVELVEGEETHVVGSIYQAGNVEGTEEIELTATHNETGETAVVGSQDVTLSPGFYHLGAINISYVPDEPGTYDLELGDRNAGWVEVDEPVVDPSIVAVDGYSTGETPETADAVYASDDATVEIDVEADLDLAEVTVLVDSLETTYTVSTTASHESGDRWIADVPFDSIPDDGSYALSVVAVDELDNAGSSDAAETLVVDRDAPAMAVSLEDVTNTDATVVVESDEPLSDVPDVSAEFTNPDNGSTESVDVAMDPESATATEFTGTLEFDESGNYSVSVTGTDRAGNENTDTASVVVDTAFTLADGVIVIEETGTTIEFDLADDAEDAIKEQELFLALSENTVDANLDGGEYGAGFLTAELDNFVDYHLDEGTIEGATIELAIDEDELADGVDAEDAVLHHYDEPAGEWNAVDSSVTAIDGDPFVTAEVPGFSTYGALIVDEEPPELVSASPDSGETLDADTTETTVAFEYEDALSGVDVSTVDLTVDGTDVTGDERTSITSTSATHTLEVEAGNSYDATVSLSDAAGNDVTYDVTFDVASSGADESDDDESEDGPGDGIPGFGLVAALVALLAIALFRTR
ncbi:right-handed parallel beta-helix repeat-containing protein [Natronorubrum tibetense]|uniref:S-layer-related duplication domain-containing protein n=1 Tax=Natronorubrum tibetense GA33 TaxID=1114856 RepID=L9W5K4_9EURY|nr:right-handed parallel beta-helix repeat-containing protein [Natronorubrum tibetense]ELY44637.1 S-layer-related duplication domain-containing protein [Natronorubrum tibetense GA33]